MIIELISHACLKYNFKGFSLLTDPWITDDPIKSKVIYKFPPQKKSEKEALDGVEYVFVSHTHEDHFHLPSIQLISRDVKILISNFSFAPHQQSRNLVLLDTLKGQGFTNVQVLRPWEWIRLKHDVDVCLIPSAKSRDMDWENSGLAIRSDGHVSLCMNDNMVDELLATQIKKFFGFVDTYFVQTAGLSTYPACFVMPEEEKEIELKAKVENYDLHQLIIDNISPKFLIPYAGDFGWFGKYAAHTFHSRSSPIGLLGFLKSVGQKTALFEPGDMVICADSGSIKFEKDGHIPWDNIDLFYDQVAKKYKSSVDKWDNRDEDVVIGNYREHIDTYFRDLARYHQESGPICNFNASLTYKISDTRGESHCWSVKALNGHTLKLQSGEINLRKCHQIHHIELVDFISILKGEFMISEIQWRTKIEQNGYCEASVLLIFFINYYLDKGNRCPEYLLRRLYKITG